MTSPTAQDIMTRSVVTFSPTTSLEEAIQTLLTRRFSGAPVVDGEGMLVGILSEKDCLRVLTAQAFDGLPSATVGDFMSHPVVSVSPATSIFDIVANFLAHHHRRLPVIDEGGRLIGLVSRRDVLAAIGSMRDNPYLYGTKEHPVQDDGEGMAGVDSAMRHARKL